MGYKWYGPAIWADMIRVVIGRKTPKNFRWLPFARQADEAEQRLRKAVRDLAARENEDGK
jgi:hypothetical protein